MFAHQMYVPKPPWAIVHHQSQDAEELVRRVSDGPKEVTNDRETVAEGSWFIERRS